MQFYSREKNPLRAGYHFGRSEHARLRGRLALPLPLMKRGKQLMTPQEIQRTMDFILRSQADSVIRMERWEERSDEQQQKIDELIVTVRDAARAIHEAAKASEDAAKASRDAIRVNRNHSSKNDS
jgi:hypothetical protein